VNESSIKKMELNDNSDYQQCFVCGQRNPFGLQLVFYQEQNAQQGETVVSDFRPKVEHQGFPGVIHGGIVAAILDEALNRTCALSKNPSWSMTGKLEESERGRMLQASGKITLADDETKVLATAQGTFMSLSTEMSEVVMRDYPEMRDFFKNQQ
jgi:hypothetical protein